MAKVIWTDLALDDLRAHHGFIERDSLFLANRVVEHILAAVDTLERFPASARMLPELNRPDVRRIVVCRFRVIYQLRGADVWIVMVHRGMLPLDRHELLRRLENDS